MYYLLPFIIRLAFPGLSGLGASPSLQLQYYPITIIFITRSHHALSRACPCFLFFILIPPRTTPFQLHFVSFLSLFLLLFLFYSFLPIIAFVDPLNPRTEAHSSSSPLIFPLNPNYRSAHPSLPLPLAPPAPPPLPFLYTQPLRTIACIGRPLAPARRSGQTETSRHLLRPENKHLRLVRFAVSFLCRWERRRQGEGCGGAAGERMERRKKHRGNKG